MRNYRTLAFGAVLAMRAIVAPASLPAQLAPPSGTWMGGADSLAEMDSVRSASVDATERQSSRPAEFRWYHAGAVLGGVALASLLDETVRDNLQAHRTAGKNDVAKIVRHFGQPEVYATVALGTLAAGLISGNDGLRRAGERITASLLLAGTVVVVTKEIVGRHRPDLNGGAYRFKPFSKQDSWPSGHTTTAFALAASVSDEIHSTPVTIGLYSAATLTGWSRMNDNRHWLSDVLAGAALGITSAKLMNGHWRVFGVGAPHFLLEPDRVGLSLQF
ncbi:MAG: phosphatase PAP2 family protein [Gemmatimonadota bacterium]